MSEGVWIFLGLVVLAVVILKVRSGGSKASEEDSVENRYKKRDALAPVLLQECVRAAQALPILDEGTIGLLHDPVYDAKVDRFDPPCTEGDFQGTTGKCWRSPDTIHDVFEFYADQEASFRLELSRPRTNSVVAADDHIDVVHCHQSVNEPGVNVTRVCRVAEDRWHVHSFRCGMEQGSLGIAAGDMKILLASDSGLIDPPIKAVDVARDPALWTKREETLRGRWKMNGHYRDAARLCTHRPQA